MLPLHLLDDDTVEALLAGRPVTPGLAPLAGAVGELRAAARQPVRPSAELAQRLASGDFSGISPAPLAPEPASHRLRTWLAGVSPRARVVTGAVVLFTGLTAATAAGALPGGAQARMETLIETVTPISFQRDEPAPEPVDVEDVRGPGSGGDSSTTEDPGSPVTPPPGKPETPPGKPDEPGNPDKPESKPDEPPGKPESPGKPDSPPGQEDRPAKPDTPEKPEKPEKPNGTGGSQGHGDGSGNGNGQGNGNGSGDRPHGPDR